MATNIEGSTPPSDAQWISVSPDDLYIQKSGEWAVKEFNWEHLSNLILNAIYESWVIMLAFGYGNLYLLLLDVTNGGLRYKYEAIVWVKPEECGRNLVSFKQVDTNSSQPDL